MSEKRRGKIIAMLRSPMGGAVAGATLALLVLLPLWWGASRWYQSQRLTQRKNQAKIELSLRANVLTAALNRRLVLLEGLQAFIQAEVDNPAFQRNFDSYAGTIYEGTAGIRNIAVAPGGIVFYVYPFSENQQLIGYNPLKDPDIETRQDMQMAIESEAPVMSGPQQTGQGRIEFMVAQPIYRDNLYWGLVMITFDMGPIIDRAAIESGLVQSDIALRDDAGRLIYGSESVFQADPVTQRVEIADDYLELAAVPAGGWLSPGEFDTRIFQITGLIIVLLLVGLVYLSVNRQQSLADAVQLRTAELLEVNIQLQRDIAARERAQAALRERESQYRLIFESARDGLFINTLDGTMVDFNPAAAHMHGYTVEEFRELQPADFIHPDSIGVFQEYIQTIKSGGQFRGRAVDVRKDGSLIYVEVIGTQFTYQGKPHTLAVVRDVTEQVQAYTLLEQRVDERTRELYALLEVSRNVASTLEVEPLLTEVLKQLKTVVDYTGAAIATLEGEEFIFLEYIGPADAEYIKSIRIPANIPSYYKEVFESREPVIRGDMWAETPAQETAQVRVRKILGEQLAYARSWLGVPLQVKDRMIGVLRIDHEEADYFTAADARLARAFADHAAVAIENAHLYEQAHSLASLQERQKLARELHDSVSQALYGIALGARTARVLVEREQPSKENMAESLDYVLSLAEAGLAEMRALIFELRPESLELEGLAAALTKQAAATRARYNLQVEIDLCDEPPISLDRKEVLYRVAQEGMHNAVKHAQATKISLTMHCDERNIQLEVRDDGVGFDPDQEFPGHLGLRSMRERMERYKGTLQVESAPKEGTRIHASLPLGALSNTKKS